MVLISLCFVIGFAGQAGANTLGFADVVLDYFDSGQGPIAGPYGGTYPGTFPTSVSYDVVLGDDPGSVVDFLSLPMDSYITLGFLDETIIDGPGNDIFIREVGPSGERADVYISSDNTNFTFLGTAQDNITTLFDLNSIGYTDQVTAIKIIGLDNFGGSPGFDVVNVEVLPGSIGPSPTPEPATLCMLGFGIIGLLGFRKKYKK